jgi:TP901 family phage tail tape measure protein
VVDRTVTYRLRADLTQFKAQMAQAGAATKKAAADMTSMDKAAVRQRQSLASLGSAAGKVGLVAAAGLGVAIVKAADFDASMSQVEAATGEAAAGMAKLREAALEAGARTAFSATEAAAGITELAKAGISTQDILAGGLSGALDLAAAGQIEVAEAAEYSAKAMTQFSLAGDQVPHVADLLAAAAGKAVGEVGDFGQALNQVGLVASQTGLSIEDTVGTLAAFSQAGLSGSDAGTAFKSMLQRLQNPLGQGAKALEQYGISAYDTQGNFVGITEVAGQLQEKFAGVDQATRDAAMAQIFGSDAVRAAAVLYREGADGIQDWIDQTNDSGFAAEQAATKLDNLKGDLEELGGALETALIGTGSGSQGILRNLTQGLTSVINKYNELPSAAQTATSAVLAGTALLGGSIWVGSKLVQGIASTRVALTDLGITAEGTRKRLLTLNNAARAGAGLAALGLAATDLDEDLGVSNTAMYALYGTMILPGWGTAIGAIVGGMSDLSAGARESAASIEAWQAQIGSLVDAGQLVQAEEEVARIREEIATFEEELSGGFTGGLRNLLSFMGPEQGSKYTNLGQQREALAGLEKELADAEAAARAAAGGQNALDTATTRATPAAERHAVAVAAQAKAMEAARKAARDTATSFFNLGDAIKDGKQSLGSFLKNLEDQAAALRDFRKNAEQAAKRGLDEGLIASLREAGPEGARQMRNLANATDAEIKRANRAWQSGQKEINRYTNEVSGVPTSVSTDVNVNGVDSAISRVDALGREISSLQDRSVTVHTVFTSSGKRFKEFASGGYVTGPGTATSDSIPARLSDGEFVMKAAAVDRYGPDFMHKINSLRYAEGGMVGSAPSASSSHSFSFAPALVEIRDPWGGRQTVELKMRQIARSEMASAATFDRRLQDRD